LKKKRCCWLLLRAVVWQPFLRTHHGSRHHTGIQHSLSVESELFFTSY
jgi:hypothetical protein